MAANRINTELTAGDEFDYKPIRCNSSEVCVIVLFDIDFLDKIRKKSCRMRFERTDGHRLHDDTFMFGKVGKAASELPSEIWERPPRLSQRSDAPVTHLEQREPTEKYSAEIKH